MSGERVVAGWILEERLGSGGFGEVWRARRRHAGSPRALKLIRIGSQESFDSWRHEIGRLENLSHPNVVRFYDADVISEVPYHDHAWISTELCVRSLADELKRRPDRRLSETECDQLLDEMLAALTAAHGSGCVHRDLKPANILWHESGVWKLCDFGTARLVPSGASHPETRVVGTSPYMSPAAHRGHQDQAADLYALGVTVHEALCGERLHPRAEGVSDSEHVRLILETPPTISPELPLRWATVVRALIGSYGARSAGELAAWFTATRGATPPPGVSDPAPAAPPAPTVPAPVVAPTHVYRPHDPTALQPPTSPGPWVPPVQPVPPMPSPVTGYPPAPSPGPPGSRLWLAYGLLAVAVVLLAGGVAFLVLQDDDDENASRTDTTDQETSTTNDGTVTVPTLPDTTRPPTTVTRETVTVPTTTGTTTGGSDDVLVALAENVYGNTPTSLDEDEAVCIAEVIIGVVGEELVTAVDADYQAIYAQTTPDQDDAIATGIYPCTDLQTDDDLVADSRWPDAWEPRPS